MQTVREILGKYVCHDYLGEYRFCEITQIVLFSKRISVNFFTNVECSSKYKELIPFHFVTDKPITIGKDENGDVKLAISRYIISIEELLKLIDGIEAMGMWMYKGKDVVVDDTFPSDVKYVPESDPTGGQYNVFVPLEYGIYNSNFMGNYYAFELISRKTALDNILSNTIILKIQQEMKKCGLCYRLDKMRDRIGNVIIKMPIEVLSVKPVKRGTYGIELEYSLNRVFERNRYCLTVLQTHDGLIYTNSIETDFDCKSVRVNPNQYKTTISVVDTYTQLTLYYGCFDYSIYSNYFSQITPPTIVAQIPDKRILHIEGKDILIDLPNVKMLGSIYVFEEAEMASKRKLSLDDDWYRKQGYLKSYSYNEHEKALHDIVEIMSNNLPWDLQEIWVIDPYLRTADIANTAFQCRVKGIKIKALCDYSAIHGNRYTREAQGEDGFDEFKRKERADMALVLGDDTDIQIDHRTVRDGHSFHDRYIIMKYELNKERVWSLGASINSIGSKHSIMQIVIAPQVVISQFEEIWLSTDKNECIIFSNSNK